MAGNYGRYNATRKGCAAQDDRHQARRGRRFYCIPKGERYPIGHDTDAIALRNLVGLLMAQWYAAAHALPAEGGRPSELVN